MGTVLAVLGAFVVSACAFIQFEKGAYVVRDLKAVYSQQEDLTFLSWKLRSDANLNEIDFELYRDGGYQEIDLQKAFFPAAPYECGDDRLCFQYQIEGRYTPPDDQFPIRTRHEDRGLFAGEGADSQVVETTFDANPVGVDNNRGVAPVVVDWFDANDVPLRRDWQWQFVDAGGSLIEPSGCDAPQSDDWSTMGPTRARSGSVDVDYGWVSGPTCLALRPDGQTIEETVIRRALPPSAETVFTDQTYQPNKIEAPIYYGVLLDMSIQNEERCESVRSQLLGIISDSVSSQGDPTKMGGYRPISPETGQPLSGCDQVPGRTYPLDQMVQDAADVDGQLAPTRVRILFIYINNSPLPLADGLRQDIRALNGSVAEESGLRLANWAIGSGMVLQLADWDRQIGWRPIGTDTFRGQIEAAAEAALPYSTMDHENDRNITIQSPEEGFPSGRTPQRFKVCRSTPVPVRVGASAEPPMFSVGDPSVPWPDNGEPYVRVNFSPQILVPDSNYRQRRVDLDIEICTRFCSHPFMTQGRGIYDSWSQTSAPQPMEVCKWQP